MRLHHVTTLALWTLCGCATGVLPDEPTVAEPEPIQQPRVERQAHAVPQKVQRGHGNSGTVHVSYEVVATTCPKSNTGWWLDGAEGWVELDDGVFTLTFEGFPDLTGTLDQAGGGDLAGQTVFMKGDAPVNCDVTGRAQVLGDTMSGTVTERLSGGQTCATVGRFSFLLPK